MTQIYSLEVKNLNVKEIKEVLQLEKQIDLEKVEAGRQPNACFILAKLLSESKIFNHNGKKGRKLILQEVKEDGQLHKKFEMFVYGNYIEKLDQCVTHIRKKTGWILFTNITFQLSHRRHRHEWSPYVIKLAEEDDTCNVVPILSSYQSVSKHINYISIDRMTDGKKHDIFAIVVRVLKEAQPTRQENNKHSMFAITDPSCHELKDILLHVFFNSKCDRFPCSIQKGDIIQIRHMLVDFFRKNKPSGKVFSPNEIRIFRNEEGCLSIYSQKSNYIYTIGDQVKVKELTLWWKKWRGMFEFQSIKPPDKITKKRNVLMKLSDIDSPGSFNLECQIVLVQDVPDYNAVQLRVVDGTICKIYISQLDFENASSCLNSQTDRAVFSPAFIDIVVFRPLLEAQKLKPNELVRLNNIKCSEIADLSVNNTDQILLFDFQMDDDATIVPLDKNTYSVREIERRIKAKCSGGSIENEEIRDSQNSLLIRANNIVKENYSAVFGNLSMDASMPETSSPAKVHKVIQSIETNQKEDKIGQSTIGTSSQKSCTKDVNSNGEANMPQESQSSTRSNAITDSSSYIVEPTPENTCNGRISLLKSPYSAVIEELNFVPIEKSRPLEESVKQSSRLFREYLNNKKNMNKIELHLKLLKIKVISILSHPKGGTASNLVWGLCTTCGDIYSSVALRESFQSNDLINSECLHCFTCKNNKKAVTRSHSMGFKKSQKLPIQLGGTVVPFYCAIFFLCDLNEPETTVEAKITGDEAEIYFGIKPDFKFVIENEAEEVRNILSTKFKLNSILKVNLVRLQTTSDDIYIC